MASQVVRYVIVADDQATKNLEKTAKSTSRVGDQMQKMGQLAVAFVAGKALGAVKAYVDESVQAFSELEQSVGGTEAVFGDAGGAIDDFAGQAAQALGLSEAEFRTATTSIGGQLKRMTGDVDLAAEQSIALTEVAADLAATYGGTTAEAVAALGSAFRGEADPAERFNLNLKAGAVSAKAIEMGLADSTGAVDDNARAQATLALITEQSADAQGQFAREADTVAGQAQITTATLENHQAIVGETLQAYATWGNVIKLGVSEALAGLAVDIQSISGELSKGEAWLKKWEISSGQTVETMDSLASLVGDTNRAAAEMGTVEDWFSKTDTAARQLVEDLPTLIAGLDMTTEELLAAVEGSDALAHEMGLTAEQALELDATLREELGQALDESSTNFGRAGGAAREWRENIATTADVTGTASAEMEADLEALAAEAEKIFEEVSQAADDYMTGFEELPERTDITLEAWTGTMTARLDDFRAWNTNMALIAEYGLEGLVAEFSAAGPEAAGGLAQEVVDHMRSGDTSMVWIAEQAAQESIVIGRQLATGSAAGVDNYAYLYVQSVEAMVEAGLARAKRVARIESPSKRFALEVGKPIAEGIAEGIEDSDAPQRAIEKTVVPTGVPNGSHTATTAPTWPTRPTTVIYMTINALDPQAAKKAVVEALQAYNRSDGPLPIDIRGS